MNLNSVVGKMSRINIFNIKGEKLCQESLQDPTLLQILLLLRVKCVPNQKKHKLTSDVGNLFERR